MSRGVGTAQWLQRAVVAAQSLQEKEERVYTPTIILSPYSNATSTPTITSSPPSKRSCLDNLGKNSAPVVNNLFFSEDDEVDEDEHQFD